MGEIEAYFARNAGTAAEEAYDGVHVAVARDAATGDVMVVLDNAAATGLRLIAEHMSAQHNEILGGSAGFDLDVASDVAATAGLLHGLLRQVKAGGY